MSTTDRMSAGSFRSWILQDWAANEGRGESQLLLAWFRFAQWGYYRWGSAARLAWMPYWWITMLVVGIELPMTADVGPRLRLYHPHAIVLNPGTVMGADCHLRHCVTVGNRTDRNGDELGAATVGDAVDLGAGCAIIGDIHVGHHARIGALAAVTKPIPPWSVVVGNPAKIIRTDDPSLAQPVTDNSLDQGAS
jgi:putative colanic acid biosynthesis acetyltransferase WcaB